MSPESRRFLKFKMKLIDLIQRKLSGGFYKKMISDFFKEVVGDIRILEEVNRFQNKSPLDCFYNDREEDDYEPNPAIKEVMEWKYKKEYCPICLFKYFNQSEKIKYLMLRIEIDKLLDIKNTSYPI